jgi:hypothetical protein
MRKMRGTLRRIAEERGWPALIDLLTDRPANRLVTQTKEEYSYTFSASSTEGEPIVYAIKSDRCAAHDDHERRVLGLMGQYI